MKYFSTYLVVPHPRCVKPGIFSIVDPLNLLLDSRDSRVAFFDADFQLHQFAQRLLNLMPDESHIISVLFYS